MQVIFTIAAKARKKNERASETNPILFSLFFSVSFSFAARSLRTHFFQLFWENKSRKGRLFFSCFLSSEGSRKQEKKGKEEDWVLTSFVVGGGGVDDSMVLGGSETASCLSLFDCSYYSLFVSFFASKAIC